MLSPSLKVRPIAQGLALLVYTFTHLNKIRELLLEYVQRLHVLLTQSLACIAARNGLARRIQFRLSPAACGILS